jgi:ankyrin repeat protein
MDACNAAGDSPLHVEVRNRNESAIDDLIRKGANLNIRNATGATALHLACQIGYSAGFRALAAGRPKPEALAELRAAGFPALGSMLLPEYRTGYEQSDVNQPDNAGITPLMAAVASDSYAIAEHLLIYKADVNAATPSGRTALLVACTQPILFTVLIDLLMDNGANLDAEERDVTTGAVRTVPGLLEGHPRPWYIYQKTISHRKTQAHIDAWLPVFNASVTAASSTAQPPQPH